MPDSLPLQASSSAASNLDSDTNAAAVLTYVALAGKRHVIPAIFFSYNAAPTGGRLTVEDVAGNIVFDIDITASGPGRVAFSPYLRSAAENTAMIITLFAGGAAVVGKLSVPGYHPQG